MKKILSFVGGALFIACITISCNHKTVEEVADSIEATAMSVVENETMSDEEHEAMLNAAREAGQAKCNCYKTDAASVEACFKSILSEKYAAYEGNQEFITAMEIEYHNCLKDKATDAVVDAANKGADKISKSLGRE